MIMMMIEVHYKLLIDIHSMSYQYKIVWIYYNIIHVNKSVDFVDYYLFFYQHNNRINLSIQSKYIR